MKILYQCEICGSLYDDENKALDCEKQGYSEPKYDKSFRFGVYEVRSKRIKSIEGTHIWCYDVRREGVDPGIWEYLEFTEKEIDQYFEPSSESK